MCWRLCKFYVAIGVTNARGVFINNLFLNREFIKDMDLTATSKTAMANLRRSPTCVLIILALLGVLIGFSQETAPNLKVQAGDETIHLLNLVI